MTEEEELNIAIAFANLELLELKRGKRTLTQCPGVEEVAKAIAKAKQELVLDKEPDEHLAAIAGDMMNPPSMRDAAREKLMDESQPSSDRVQIPDNEPQAVLMAQLGIMWLSEYAPHKLAQPIYTWHPIATVPKTGKFIVWIPSTKLPWPAYAAGDRIYSNAHGLLNEPYDKRVLTATHWMPLPPAPIEP